MLAILAILPPELTNESNRFIKDKEEFISLLSPDTDCQPGGHRAALAGNTLPNSLPRERRHQSDCQLPVFGIDRQLVHLAIYRLFWGSPAAPSIDATWNAKQSSAETCNEDRAAHVHDFLRRSPN